MADSRRASGGKRQSKPKAPKAKKGAAPKASKPGTDNRAGARDAGRRFKGANAGAGMNWNSVRKLELSIPSPAGAVTIKVEFGGPRPESVQDIVNDAADDAKTAVDGYPGPNGGAPIAVVMWDTTSASYRYGNGCDSKDDLSLLVERAKYRLSTSGTQPGEGPAYHQRSATNLGTICVVSGDQYQNPPYPVLGDDVLDTYLGGVASLSVYTSQHDP